MRDGWFVDEFFVVAYTLGGEDWFDVHLDAGVFFEVVDAGFEAGRVV